MFPDYRNLILEDFRKKSEQQLLPNSLLLPSPAKLREECLKICEERYQPRDLKTLRDFFGVVDGKDSCLKAISRFEIDKFKPLINYLKGETEDTNEKNIELLAWLIDFQPRPYELGRKYIGEKEAIEGLELAAAVQPLAKTPQIEPRGFEQRKNQRFFKWLVPGALAILAVTGFSIMKFRKTPPTVQSFADLPSSCMYWTGELYKVVPCGTRPGSAIVLPLDTFLLRNFKKVTQPDTISLRSAGKLWYIKRNNNLDVFTVKGNHPEELHRQLKPLSAYMIKKHILGKQKIRQNPEN
ncbi:hypothetical protein [Flavihumibacter sp. UBA7668]|uniref:hypothetical protein n=1 Tax=Flavihumibacter sp. UBA7668 TaxID=1946542 RepID=UPI0025BF6EBA|nr:hypothetical protein [Flavihumibacter sp. UBA7668]